MGVIKFRLVKFDKTLLFQIIEQSNKTAKPGNVFGVICEDSDGSKFLVASANTIQFRPVPTTPSTNDLKYSIFLRGNNDNHKLNKICITTYDNNDLRDYWYDKFMTGLKLGISKIDNWEVLIHL